MKTVITSSGNNVNSSFDLRFGRAAWFCMYNEKTKDISFIENENLNGSGGVGIKTAEKMVELDVKKIISGDFGPKAKNVLDKFGIQLVIMNDDTLTIQDIINKISV